MSDNLKRNLILAAALIIVFGSVQIYVSFFAGANKPGVAVVELQGEEYARLDLSVDTEITVETSLGTNTIEVSSKKVRVVSADCPDKICVHTGSTDSADKPIACLPHELIIYIE